MESPETNSKRFAFISAILGFTAVLLQFYLIIDNRVASVLETIIRFFSFFTILTNSITAIAFAVIAGRGSGSYHRFFSRPKVFTGITVCMTIVGVVYNLVLRSIWQPQGLQLVVDELLHVVMPALTVIYWIIFVPKNLLRWKDILPWLIYPAVYFILVIIRGYFSGFYPYPFINMSELGFQQVFINAFLVLAGFIAVSVIFISIGRFFRKRDRIFPTS